MPTLLRLSAFLIIPAAFLLTSGFLPTETLRYATDQELRSATPGVTREIRLAEQSVVRFRQAAAAPSSPASSGASTSSSSSLSSSSASSALAGDEEHRDQRRVAFLRAAGFGFLGFEPDSKRDKKAGDDSSAPPDPGPREEQEEEEEEEGDAGEDTDDHEDDGVDEGEEEDEQDENDDGDDGEGEADQEDDRDGRRHRKHKD